MQVMLRSQSAIIHQVTEFLNQVNKKAIENGKEREYTEAIQWCIMGKTKNEIKLMAEMLSTTLPFIMRTIEVLAMEIVDREQYE